MSKKKSKKYGIYDTKDHCWIGDETGPRLFTEKDSRALNGMPHEVAAKIAAQIYQKQAGFLGLGRFEAREFKEKSLKLKDEIPTKMGAEEALRRIEEGG